MYVGYWNPLGFSDYSLDEFCPITSNSTFYAAFERNKAKDSDPVQNVTAVFCWPSYYQQRVIAAVDAVSLEPFKVDIVGEKEPLSKDLFNTPRLEELMASNSLGDEVRGDLLPSKSTPDYLDFIARTNLSLSSGPNGAGIVAAMVGLALAVSDRPLEDYLDWKVLSKSYADAYRLMFARAMRDVLDDNFRTTDEVTGQIVATTEAVVLEPVFVYIVESFLGVVSVATIALLYLSLTRKKHLRSNPSTIAAVMAMVAENQPLLSDVEGLDCCTMEEIKKHLGDKRYKLVDDGSTIGIVELDAYQDITGNALLPDLRAQRRDTPSDIAKPVRPIEFRLWVVVPFVSLFITLAICLSVLFVKARMQGLPLPSSNSIVQNLLENYIPTAIATLIEPMWILINRLLCMLQPIEELQSCNARAKKSIDLDYSSLPPQLVFFKALRSKHFVLAAVCAMALLANLLAIAFSGLFNQATIDMRHPTVMKPPFDFKVVPINGSIGPIGGLTFGALSASGAYQGGSGMDQFLLADSYLKKGIPLPAWTDETMFYQPLFLEEANNTNGHQLGARTRAFGAKLECTAVEFGNEFHAGLLGDDILPSVNITITSATGKAVKCSRIGVYMRAGPISNVLGNCVTGPSAAELIFTLVPTANATQEEAAVCMGSVVLGWLRDPNGSCPKAMTGMLNEQNATFVHCRPKLMTGFATIQVDSSGRLQQDVKDLTVEDAADDVFSNDPINLVGQSNEYIFSADSQGWHNDSFADDFINYFITHSVNSSRLVDPKQGLPSFDDIEGPLNKAYSLLFAIWLGINKDKLFIPYETTGLPTLDGWRIEPETRLFMSTPMFIISEVILCTYAIVAIMVYMRRPGQYLARMPTSIASVVALFAASAAVLDMAGTSYLDKKGRAHHLEEVDARYGYGSYIGGGDGRVHIGIEKSPFVRVRSKTTWFEKKVNSFR
ncbi:hypothetical protein N0V83_000439 [Neocucurbitaria cava]|uniref:Uncharacterized protein n=1 Tax=Neocucurbitaria cava TaxID=798079 RepID=A0A9W8YJV9_9PLEO|nr:hypothetical protein N0V83_000439 [Neocucurbitaria cava]